MRVQHSAKGANMKKDNILFVSLNTHKKFYHVANAEDAQGKTPVDTG